MTWEAPESDGGSPILRYVIEKRSAGRVTWSKVTTVKELTAIVTDLNEGKMFEFKVAAENKFGMGEGAEIGPVLAAFTFDVPGAPGTPECLDTTQTSTTVTWTPPESDGGSPVLGYHVERRIGKVGRWVKITKTLVKTTTHTVMDLTESETYEFRVLAENKKGVGKPSQPCSPMKALTKEKIPKTDDSLASASISRRPDIIEPRGKEADQGTDESINQLINLIHPLST